MDKEKFDDIFNSVYVVQDFDEFLWLVNKVETLNPKAMIEIGVERGGTLRFWLETLSRNGIAIGIDNWPGLHTIEQPLKEVAESKNIDLNLICGKSENQDTIELVKQHLKGREIDFLFIDATHTDDAARQDFENYTPFLRKGGLVGFHDINDIKGFYDSLQGKKETLIKTIGTGIWWKE